MRVLAAALLLACTRREVADPLAEQAASDAEFAALVQTGDDAFARRGDPEQLAAAVAVWEEALAARPAEGRVRGRLARAAWFAGYAAEGPERLARWREAEAWAAPCQDSELACRYWGARATSDAGWERSVSLGLRAGADVAPIMARVEADLPGLDGAGAARWRAGWLARVPTFAGADLGASAALYGRVAEAAPDQLLNLYERAAFHAVRTGDEEAFVRALDAIAVAPASETWEPENAITRSRAAALLSRRAELFPPPEEPR